MQLIKLLFTNEEKWCKAGYNFKKKTLLVDVIYKLCVILKERRETKDNIQRNDFKRSNYKL
jgi:hypothetical protein